MIFNKEIIKKKLTRIKPSPRPEINPNLVLSSRPGSSLGVLLAQSEPDQNNIKVRLGPARAQSSLHEEQPSPVQSSPFYTPTNGLCQEVYKRGS